MISLCMIVKNEEAFLEKCLQSAAEYFNDIVVADTGSSDGTKTIATKYGARVFDFDWIHDFSAARNFSASHAVNDWVFYLDADETVSAFDRAYVEEFIKDTGHLGSVACYDIDVKNNNDTIRNNITRLYNRRFFAFTDRIHEQLTPFDPGISYEIREIPVEINHSGYLPEVMIAKNKFERNRQLLSDELRLAPDNPYLLYQLGKTYFSMSEDMNKACECFEKALDGKPNFSLEYVYTLVECYGYALLRSGRFKDSMKIFDYKKYYDHNPCFRFLLAHIYQNNGMLIEAVESFESCIGSDDSDRPGIGSFMSFYNIAVILEVVGMVKEAKEYYKKCGEYKPAVERLKLIT